LTCGGSQRVDRVFDPVLFLADDDGGVAAHPAAVADDHRFLAIEDGYGLRLVRAGVSMP